MLAANFLWLDFRRDTSTAGLCQSLAAPHEARNVAHPHDVSAHIQAWQPRLICFEFDSPQVSDLLTLLQTRRQNPDLPLLMITEDHSESLAVWAFRSGVWDYLVKPLTANELNARLEELLQLLQTRQSQYSSPPWPITLPDGLQQSCLQVLPQAPRTAMALDYVQSHFSETVRLSAVAGHCHMSESEFSRVFKKEHGVTFCECLMKFRISKACESLGDPRVQVKTVALDVGFNDLSYFARTFRRHTGVTPSTYQHVRAM